MSHVVRLFLLVQIVTLALGQIDRPKRILNGILTPIEHKPYQVSLMENGNHFCGGCILSSRWILTAAHCLILDSRHRTRVDVRVGANHYHKEGIVLTSNRNFVHPYYNRVPFDYDVALIDLMPNFIPLNNVNQKAIQLINSGATIPPNTNIGISGWGTIDNYGTLSYEGLMLIHTTTLHNQICKRYYKNITDRMLCLDSGYKKTCQGDSGGPVVSIKYNILIGLVSFGYKQESTSCDIPKYPSVLTNLADPGIRNWIKNIAGI